MLFHLEAAGLRHVWCPRAHSPVLITPVSEDAYVKCGAIVQSSNTTDPCAHTKLEKNLRSHGLSLLLTLLFFRRDVISDVISDAISSSRA